MKLGYEQITKTVAKSGACPACGRTTRRTRTFVRMVNRFNRWPDGRAKSRSEVRDEVMRAASEWQQDADLRHERCR